MLYFGEPEVLCCVCNETLPAVHFAECMNCFKQFHIRMTETDREAKDCGTVYLDDEDFYMVFLCNLCFEAQQGA